VARDRSRHGQKRRVSRERIETGRLLQMDGHGGTRTLPPICRPSTSSCAQMEARSARPNTADTRTRPSQVLHPVMFTALHASELRVAQALRFNNVETYRIPPDLRGSS
jgi:hypothetical protein